jgi:hypothetical protein
MRAVQDARRSGDFRELRRRFRRTVIKTTGGDLRPETDVQALRELDDAGLLQLDEVLHYEPLANAASCLAEILPPLREELAGRDEAVWPLL